MNEVLGGWVGGREGLPSLRRRDRRRVLTGLGGSGIGYVASKEAVGGWEGGWVGDRDGWVGGWVGGTYGGESEAFEEGTSDGAG